MSHSDIPTSTANFGPRDDGAEASPQKRTITSPPGTVRVTARYAEPLSSEAVAALWEVVRPATLKVSNGRVTLLGVTDDEDVRGLADRIVDELPGDAQHVEVTWQAGSDGGPWRAGPDGTWVSGDDIPF